MSSLHSTSYRQSPFHLFHWYNRDEQWPDDLRAHVFTVLSQEKGSKLFAGVTVCGWLTVCKSSGSPHPPVPPVSVPQRGKLQGFCRTLGLQFASSESPVDLNYSSAAGTHLLGHPSDTRWAVGGLSWENMDKICRLAALRSQTTPRGGPVWSPETLPSPPPPGRQIAK